MNTEIELLDVTVNKIVDNATFFVYTPKKIRSIRASDLYSAQREIIP